MNLKRLAQLRSTLALSTSHRSLFAAFSDILVSGPLFGTERGASCLVVSNHICDWDLRVSHFLTHSQGLSYRCFANPSVLEAQPGLAAFGLVPIPRDDPMAAAKVLAREGRQLAAEDGTALWVFPQGGYSRLSRGAAVESGAVGVRKYSKSAGFTCVAMHYEFYGPRRPWVWVKAVPVAEPEPRNARELGELLAATHAALLSDLANGAEGYRPMMGRRLPNAVVDTVPVVPAVVNAYLSADPATAGCELVTDPGDAAVLRFTGRAVEPAQLERCLRQNLGAATAQVILERAAPLPDPAGPASAPQTGA
jgi:1-acyl-sn-glycerol-3-phosphate acyltransferase